MRRWDSSKHVRRVGVAGLLSVARPENLHVVKMLAYDLRDWDRNVRAIAAFGLEMMAWAGNFKIWPSCVVQAFFEHCLRRSLDDRPAHGDRLIPRSSSALSDIVSLVAQLVAVPPTHR